MAKGNAATATPKVKPSEVVKVLHTINVKPSKLKLSEKLMGRHQPVSEEAVIALATNIDLRQSGSMGQQQPLQVRPVAGTDEFEVIFGNTRARAGYLIETGGWVPTGKDEKHVQPPQPDFTLRCEVVEVDDEEAFKRNLVENEHRNATSAVDKAKNHERLRNEFGMSDAAITRMMGYGHQSTVTKLRKLLVLPEPVLDDIHKGNITQNAGYYLAEFWNEFGPEKFQELLGSIKDRSELELNGVLAERISQSEVATAIKEYRKKLKEATTPAGDSPQSGESPAGEGDSQQATTPEGSSTNETATPEKKEKELTLKQFKETLKDAVGNTDGPAKLRKACEYFLGIISGNDPKAFFHWWVQNVEPEWTPPAKKEQPATE